jgi:type II secretory pathway component PulF
VESIQSDLSPTQLASLALMSGSQSRANLYRMLSQGHSAGNSVQGTLLSIADTLHKDGNQVQAQIYEMFSQRIIEAPDFAQAFNGYASDDEKLLLSTSSDAKDVGQLLLAAAEQNEFKSSLVSAAVSPVIYPWAMGFAGMGLLYFAGRSVFPALSAQLSKDKVRPTLDFILGYATFISNYWYIIIPMVVAILASILYSLPKHTGSVRKVLDYLPIYNTYKQLVALSTINTITFLLKSKMDLNQVFDKLENNSSPYLADYVNKMRTAYESDENQGEGSSPADCLNIGLINKALMLPLRIAASTISLPQALDQTFLQNKSQVMKSTNTTAKNNALVGWLLFLACIALFMLTLSDVARELAEKAFSR